MADTAETAKPEAKSEAKPEVVKRHYFYPALARSVEATSLEEAHKLVRSKK